MDKKEFIKIFKTLEAAQEFENQVLSIGSEFLPEEARAVRDGEIEDPSDAYWEWLWSQYHTGVDMFEGTEKGALSQ